MGGSDKKKRVHAIICLGVKRYSGLRSSEYAVLLVGGEDGD